MGILDNLKKPKIEPFNVMLPRALTEAEIASVLDRAVCRAAIPDRTKPGNLDFVMPLAPLFSVLPVEGSTEVVCTPNMEAIDDEAVRWCKALTELPPKALPRPQRPIIKLMARLNPKPIGNPAVDKGRRVLLDQTELSLWPAVKKSLENALMDRASR